jgi:hypothetical protein
MRDRKSTRPGTIVFTDPVETARGDDGASISDRELKMMAALLENAEQIEVLKLQLRAAEARAAVVDTSIIDESVPDTSPFVRANTVGQAIGLVLIESHRHTDKQLQDVRTELLDRIASLVARLP